MRRFTCLIAPVLACTLGCSGETLPSVRYGEEACAHCRMIINDDRFAAALSSTSGELLKFDDVGCLVAYRQANPEQPTRTWIRGYQSGQWLDADSAFFVYGPQLQTPMASGLAAVSAKHDAETLAQTWGGEILRLADVHNFLESRRKPTSEAAPAEHSNNSIERSEDIR